MQVTGFINIGAICWFNSMLQLILSSKYIIKSVLDDEEEQNNLLKEFQNFLKNYISNRVVQQIAPEIAGELNEIKGVIGDIGGTIQGLDKSLNVFAKGMEQHMKLISSLQEVALSMKQTQKPLINSYPTLNKLFRQPHKFNELSREKKDKILFGK